MRPPAERVHAGMAASPGVAVGPLVRLTGDGPTGAVGGEPDSERARLAAAIARAADELAQLAAAQADLGADILAVQIELLDDPELAGAAFAAVAQGEPARSAWLGALAAQIEPYAAEADELFRARAADLADLRDRVVAALDGRTGTTALPPGALVLDRDLSPSRFLGLDPSMLAGIALEAGSPASHVAMLARARGVPLVTGLGPVAGEGEAVVDGDAGELIVSPTVATLQRCRRRGLAPAPIPVGPAVTAAGERVEVMVNVDDPAAVGDEVLAAGDGVGLLRTEFLFLGRDRLPGEDEQLAALTGLLDRLAGRPCTARLLDIGGDKPLPGVVPVGEANPFLGLRGVRLLLERPELLRPQVRVLLRAAAAGRPLRVMVPMVTVAEEIAAVREVFAGCLAELRRERVSAELPPLGIMVETPAAAVAVDLLEADFYSIGTNDLTQYVMAAARDAGGQVARLLDPLHPAVLRLIEGVVRHGLSCGRPVSLCGDLASDPGATGALLGLGLRRLSVAPPALAGVKRAVAGYSAAAPSGGQA